MKNSTISSSPAENLITSLKSLLNRIPKDAYRFIPFMIWIHRKEPFFECPERNLESLPEKIESWVTGETIVVDDPQRPLSARLDTLESKLNDWHDDYLDSLFILSDDIHVDNVKMDNLQKKARIEVTSFALPNLPQLVASISKISSDALADIFGSLSALDFDLDQNKKLQFFEDLFKYISNQIHLPTEVSDYMLSFFDWEDGLGDTYAEESYCKDSKILSYLLKLEGNERECSSSTFLKLMNNFSTLSDTFDFDEAEWESDQIVATPLLGMNRPTDSKKSLSMIEAKCVQSILKSPGFKKAVILVSSHFLESKKSDLIRLRQKLVTSNQLDSVILMPPGILNESDKSCALLVLRNGRNEGEGFTFSDASNHHVEDGRKRLFDHNAAIRDFNSTPDDSLTKAILTKKDLEVGEYDLRPGKYLSFREIIAPDNHTIVTLSKLVQLVKGEKIDAEMRGKFISFNDIRHASRFQSTSFSDVPPQSLVEVNADRSNQISLKMIDAECILINAMKQGESLDVCWFKPDSTPIFVRSEIYVLRFDSTKVLPSWLMIALTSDSTNEQVKRLVRGSTLQRIGKNDLNSLQLVVPNMWEQQEAIVSATQASESRASVRESELNYLIEVNREEFLEDLRLKKHHLSQFVNDIQSGVATVVALLQNQNPVSSDMQISKRSECTLIEYLNDIKSKTLSLGDNMESLTNLTVLHDPERLDLLEYLRSWSAKYKNENFEVLIDTSGAELSENVLSVSVHIARRNLDEVFDNLIQNAKTHGFVDSSKNNIIRIDVTLNDNPSGFINISFTNNGKPMPEGMTTKRYVTRGEKGGMTGNTGLGGYHIKSILEHIGGSLKLINDDSNFPVGILIQLPINYEKI